jgi:hypothetical protein
LREELLNLQVTTGNFSITVGERDAGLVSAQGER